MKPFLHKIVILRIYKGSKTETKTSNAEVLLRAGSVSILALLIIMYVPKFGGNRFSSFISGAVYRLIYMKTDI